MVSGSKITYWTTRTAMVNALDAYLKEYAQGNFRNIMAKVKDNYDKPTNTNIVGLIPRSQNPSLYVLPKGV